MISWSASLYTILYIGIFCVVVGAIIRLLDLRFPNQLTTFFGVDVLQDVNEVKDAGNKEHLYLMYKFITVKS